MAQYYTIGTPYTERYDAEREFYVNILLRGVPIPQEEMQQLIRLELDVRDHGATTGQIIIGTEPAQRELKGREQWRRAAYEGLIWQTGTPLTLLVGLREDVVVYKGLYLRRPKYAFKQDGLIVTVGFRDVVSRMKRRKRQRRYNGWTLRRLIERLCTEYGLNLEEFPAYAGGIYYDNEVPLSQVNQFDSQFLDKICRRYGWRWRVRGDKMQIYHPDIDASEPPKVAYALDFRTGDFSIAKFVPKFKAVFMRSKDGKLERGKGKKPSTGNKTGKKVLAPRWQLVDKFLMSSTAKKGNGTKINDQKVGEGIGSGLDKAGAYGANEVCNQYTNEFAGRNWALRRLKVSKGQVVVVKELHPWENDVAPIKGFSAGYITANVQLAVPSMRMQPRDSVHIACGGSEQYTGLYKVKRQVLVVDGQASKVQVNLVVKRRAFLRVIRHTFRSSFALIKRPPEIRALQHKASPWSKIAGDYLREMEDKDLNPRKDEGKTGNIDPIKNK